VAKLLIGSEKVRGCKNGIDLLHDQAMYGVDRASRISYRRKVMFCLFFCLSHFKIRKFGKTETLLTITVPLYRGKFEVVKFYIQVFLWTPGLSLGVNSYQKLPFLAILGAVSPHFKATMIKFNVMMWTLDSLP